VKPAREVCHLWQVDLKEETTSEALSADERERAARFHFDNDRTRFVTGRMALRHILSGYLDCEPAKITLHRGTHGRPQLVPAEHNLEFNVSHSGDLALIAIAAQGPLGVDVEALRHMENALALARRYLTSAESTAIEAAALAQRSAAFLTCWTRKEAVLKSTGAGLTVDPRLIEVGAQCGEITLEWPLHSSFRVRLRSLRPEGEYIAACAAALSVEHIELRRFTRK
jgi:4'-phosphopantetheinyl transferase